MALETETTNETKQPSNLDQFCLLLTHAIKVARNMNIIDDEDYEKIHSAIWSVSIKHLPPAGVSKEAAE